MSWSTFAQVWNSGQERQSLIETGESAPGVIFGCEQQPSSGTIGWVEFEVETADGTVQRIEIEETFARSACQFERPVTVYYPPTDPHQAVVLENGEPIDWYKLSGGVLALCMAVGGGWMISTNLSEFSPNFFWD